MRCEESIYWDKAYYKLGILDGIKLVSEAKKMENSLKWVLLASKYILFMIFFSIN